MVVPAPPETFDCSSTYGADCDLCLSATHWNPCYFILMNHLPSLIDGAVQIVKMGFRTIKVAVLLVSREVTHVTLQRWCLCCNIPIIMISCLFSLSGLDTYVLL